MGNLSKRCVIMDLIEWVFNETRQLTSTLQLRKFITLKFWSKGPFAPIGGWLWPRWASSQLQREPHPSLELASRCAAWQPPTIPTWSRCTPCRRRPRKLALRFNSGLTGEWPDLKLFQMISVTFCWFFLVDPGGFELLLCRKIGRDPNAVWGQPLPFFLELSAAPSLNRGWMLCSCVEKPWTMVSMNANVGTTCHECQCRHNMSCCNVHMTGEWMFLLSVVHRVRSHF